jgi:hypothetical protein
MRGDDELGPDNDMKACRKVKIEMFWPYGYLRLKLVGIVLVANGLFDHAIDPSQKNLFVSGYLPRPGTAAVAEDDVVG